MPRSCAIIILLSKINHTLAETIQLKIVKSIVPVSVTKNSAE
jgi:hypothetical protein